VGVGIDQKQSATCGIVAKIRHAKLADLSSIYVSNVWHQNGHVE